MGMLNTNQLLQDGMRCSVQITGVCDGVLPADENQVLKVDVTTLSPQPRALSIERIEYNVSGGILRLWREANDNVPIIDLAGTGYFDYSHIGGMISPASPGETGNLLVSTIGFDTGSSYAVKLRMKKKLPV